MDIDLERARREAKALLAAARRGELTLREDRPPQLADAQRAVAERLGERSWPALVARVEGERILALALAGDADGAELAAAERPKAAAVARAAGAPELLDAASWDVAYALLAVGVDPNVRGPDGATPLHRAAAAGRLDVVDALVGWAPVDRLARDAQGRTPLDVATDPAVVAVLRSVTTARSLPCVHGEEMWRAEAGWLKAQAREHRMFGSCVAVRGEESGVVGDVATDAEIAAAIEWAGRGTWLVGPSSGLGPALVRAGCAPERGAVFMSARVADLAEAAPPGEGSIATSCFGGVCLVSALEVPARRRRRGIGSALLLSALHASGARLALLSPTPATVPFYERLGFTLERYPPDRVYYLPRR